MMCLPAYWIFSQASATDGVYGDLLYVKSRKGRLVQHRYWRSGDYGPRALRTGWMPPHPTLYLRRKVYEKVGNFRLDFGSAADYEFMVRLMRLPGLTLAYLPAVLVCMETGGLSNCSARGAVAGAPCRLEGVEGKQAIPGISFASAQAVAQGSAVLAASQEFRLSRLGELHRLNQTQPESCLSLVVVIAGFD